MPACYDIAYNYGVDKIPLFDNSRNLLRDNVTEIPLGSLRKVPGGTSLTGRAGATENSLGGTWQDSLGRV